MSVQKRLLLCIGLLLIAASCTKKEVATPEQPAITIDTTLVADSLIGEWEATEVVVNYYENDTFTGSWHAVMGEGTYGNGNLHYSWNDDVHATWIKFSVDGSFSYYNEEKQPKGYMLDEILKQDGQWKIIDATHLQLSTEVWEDTSFITKPIVWIATCRPTEIVVKTDIEYKRDGISATDNIQIKLQKTIKL